MSAGTLFVVATPIGNLEDITLRALRILREAHLIAAEDTRRTARLLAHHGISTPTSSFHEHNVRQRLPRLLAALTEGRNIALVTDAGTPGVSDPGVELVAACVNADIPVDPVPGVSAPLTAALASGFPMIPLTILGFPPHRSNDRNAWFAAIAGVAHTVTLFEAPHKIQRTLGDLAMFLGNRPIMAGRELTKLHQQFLFGTAESVSTALPEPRGEFTIVVGPRQIASNSVDIKVPDEDIAVYFRQLTKTGVSRRQAITDLANRLGKSARDVYSAVERVKKASS